MKKFLLVLTGLFSIGMAHGQCPPPSPLSTPYYENFDTVSPGQTGAFSNCWKATTTSDPQWESESSGTGNSSLTGPQDDYSGTGNYVYMETTSGSTGDTAGFISPEINLSALTTPELSFYYHMYGATMGTLEVQVWNGTTWTTEWSRTGEQHSSETSPWSKGLVNLTSYSGTIKLKFLGTRGSSYTGDLAIDEIKVAEAPPCPQPTKLIASNISHSTADLDWTAVGAASNGYEVIYDSTGFNPITGGTSTTVATNSATLTGLSSISDYDFYVVSDCGTTGLSDTAGPMSFTTLCAPYTAPYSIDFENDAVNAVALCWADYETYSSSWVEVEDETGTDSPFAGSQALYLYSSLADPYPVDTLFAISPRFSDLPAGDKQVRFFANSQAIESELIIGTVAGQNSPETFIAFDTITFSTANVYEEIIIPITTANGYNGTHEYLVLAHNLGGTSDDIRIDNFNYEVIPSCPKISALSFTLDSVDVTSASFSFNGQGTSYDVEFGPTGFTQGTGCTGTFNSTSITIDNSVDPGCATQLVGNTTYDVYIRTNCNSSSNGTSIWDGPYTFTTLCAPFTAPYAQSFDGTTEPDVDACWSVINSTSSSLSFVGTENLENRSAPNSIELYNSSATSGDVMAISPEFSDLDNTKRIQFYTYDDDGTSDLYIGTMSDPADAATFAPYDTITAAEMADDVWQLFIVSFDNYSGSDKHIAFKHGMNNSVDNIYIDDFQYEVIPACVPPIVTSLGIHNLTPTGGELFWATGSQGSKTYIEVGPTGFNPGTSSALLLDSVAGNIDTLSVDGLVPQTAYEFYVQDSCAPGGLSGWVGPYTFTTPCIVTAPFAESFDGTDWAPGSSSNIGDQISSCWTRNPDGTGFFWGLHDDGTSTSNTGPLLDNSGSGNYVYTEATNGSASDVAYFYTPFVDISALSDPYIQFYYHRYGSDMGDFELEINDGSGWVSVLSLTGQLQASSADPFKKIGTRLSAFGDSVQARFKITKTSFEGDMAIDDVSFGEAPSCPQILNLSVNALNDTSAVFNWDESADANSYHVWFGPQGFYQGTQTTGGTMIVTNGDSLLVDSLTSFTCYEFVVRGICSPGDSSAWAGPFTVCTPCSPFTAPYFEGFDSTATPGITDCWSEIEPSSSTIQTVTSTDHGAPIPSSANAIEFNIGSGNDDVLLISPQLAGLSTGLYQVEVKAAFEGFGDGYPDTLYFGTMSNPTNASTFTPYDTILLEGSDGSFIDFRFILDNTSRIGNDNYVAFRYGNSGGNWEYYLDDFSYELIPSCQDPIALGLVQVGTTTAEIYWMGAGAGNWDIEYGIAGFTPGTGTSTTSTNDTTTLTGLTSASYYEYYVRENCGPGNVSNWAGPFAFVTNCAPSDKLSGVYTIDAASPTGGTNYTSFSDAVAALNFCGVNGHVTFNVAAGTYNEALILTEIAGVTADSTITFDGGNASNVLLTYSSANDTPTVYLNGADYITLRNLTIENTSTDDGWGVLLQNAANYNTIDSCIIQMPVTTTTDIIGIVASNSLSFETSTGDNTNNLTVSNCMIIGGESGVHLEGSSSAPYNSGNKIIDNIFRHQDDHAVEADGQIGLIISGNDIDSLLNSGGDGIYLQNVDDFEISSNKVISPDYGIYVNDGNDGYSPSVNSMVINNMVYSSSDYGLYLNDFENTSVFHNTLVGEPAMLINDQDTVDIRNNIFVSTGDFAFESADALTATDVIDYNLYYSTHTNAFDIGVNTYADLAAWQAADAGRNQNSIEGDPVFVSTTDLHIVGPLPNDAGDNTVGVTSDIDGDVRPASGSTIVDMGADEYTPLLNDLSTVQILDPINNACGDSTNSVTVIIQNIGQQPQTGFSITADITGAVTTTLSTTYTGTLNSLQTDTVILSSFNGVNGGSINVEVYTQLSTDQDNSNDTAEVTNLFLIDGLAPVPTAALDTVCGSGGFDTLYYPVGSNDTYYWMDANNDTIGSTDSLVVGPLNAQDTTFYLATQANISYNVGPTDNSIGGGGNFANAGAQQVYFTTFKTVVIDSFAVYPDGPGNVVLNLKDQNGVVLQSDTVAVTGTGKTMIPVGFTVAPGSYEIDGDGSTTGGLYRNSAGANYPYSIPAVMEITGNSFGSGYYYFFYDWHITAAGCPKPTGSITIYNDGATVTAGFTSTPGTATANDLTVTFDANTSQGATSYSWDFGDGNTGSGVNTQHAYTANGTYNVKLIASGPCGVDSTTQTVVIEGISLQENLLSRSLQVYPNPTKGFLSIEVKVQDAPKLTLQFVDATGRSLKRMEFENLNGELRTDLDLSGLADGVYMLQISTDSMNTTRRIIKN